MYWYWCWCFLCQTNTQLEKCWFLTGQQPLSNRFLESFFLVLMWALDSTITTTTVATSASAITTTSARTRVTRLFDAFSNASERKMLLIVENAHKYFPIAGRSWKLTRGKGK